MTKANTDTALERAMASVEKIEARIRHLQSCIEGANRELVQLAKDLVGARGKLAAERIKAQQSNIGALADELRDITAAMDAGDTSHKARLFEILAAARLAKACGNSYEASRVLCERIESGRQKVRWSDFNAWIKQPQEIAA
jgi:hypothetical protein